MLQSVHSFILFALVKGRQASLDLRTKRGQSLQSRLLCAVGHEQDACLQGMLTPLLGTESSSRGRELSRLRASSSAASPAPAWLGRDGGSAAAHLAAWRSQRGFALDITAFDGADILSSRV